MDRLKPAALCLRPGSLEGHGMVQGGAYRQMVSSGASQHLVLCDQLLAVQSSSAPIDHQLHLLRLQPLTRQLKDLLSEELLNLATIFG